MSSCLLSPPAPDITTLIADAETQYPNDVQQQILQLRCAGVNRSPQQFLTLEELRFEWSNNNCPTLFQNSLFDSNNVFSSQYFTYTQRRMSSALFIYFTNRQFEPSPFVSPALQSQLLNACSNVPGICEVSQSSMCSECTREQISSSYNMLQFCGCFAPQNDQIKLPRQCDSLCTNSVSSKLRDPTTGALVECNQTVCVIDNVTLNATNSSLQNINFSQVCDQCANDNSTCQCYIDVSIPNIISTMGLEGPNLVQNCPYNQCFTVDNTTDQITPVDCQKYTSISKNYPINKYWYWALLFLFFVIVVAIFSFAYWGKNFTQVSFELFKPAKIIEYPNRFSSVNLP